MATIRMCDCCKSIVDDEDLVDCEIDGDGMELCRGCVSNIKNGKTCNMHDKPSDERSRSFPEPQIAMLFSRHFSPTYRGFYVK